MGGFRGLGWFYFGISILSWLGALGFAIWSASPPAGQDRSGVFPFGALCMAFGVTMQMLAGTCFRIALLEDRVRELEKSQTPRPGPVGAVPDGAPSEREIGALRDL
jgi:hypothetical protein